MLHPDFKYVHEHFKHCVFGVNSFGVYCEIDNRDINETKYKFSAVTPEDLLTLIVNEFECSDESYDGEYAHYITWNQIEGLDKYHNPQHKVL